MYNILMDINPMLIFCLFQKGKRITVNDSMIFL